MGVMTTAAITIPLRSVRRVRSMLLAYWVPLGRLVRAKVWVVWFMINTPDVE